MIAPRRVDAAPACVTVSCADWKAHETLIDLMVRFPNVYADTSGVRRFGYLEEAIRRAGPRKLVFGSDGPFLHPPLELEKIRLLDVGPREKALIMGGNLARLLSRRARGGSD